jgi:FkbM family methyltransferase
MPSHHQWAVQQNQQNLQTERLLMTIRKINSSFGEFQIELDEDSYGHEFWDRIENGLYEPDTMAFLKLNVDENSDFIDIGAANGSMTILAGLRGARVLSFEAAPGIYAVANRNVELNNFINEVKVVNTAISNHDGVMTFSREGDNKVLSSIVFTSLENSSTEIQVQNLSEVIQEFHKPTRDLVLKVDIEGAEWRLFHDDEIIKSLAQHKATVLLAIHPGFHRPFKQYPLGLTLFSKTVWQLRNAAETYQVFKSLLAYAYIQRTSRDFINSPRKIVALMFGGYFEFILTFDKA